jgi:hypothetical protein
MTTVVARRTQLAITRLALRLETRIADREDFVEDKDFL